MRLFSRPWRTSISAAALTAAFVISGCANSGSQGAGDRIDKLGDDGTNDPIYVSEIAADEGEELIGTDTIDRSLEKFEQAIRSNPSNSRAQFWRVYLRMMLELRGSYTRVKPLFLSVPNGAARYERFVEEQVRDMTPETRRFYLDGPEDISTPQLWQEWLERLTLKLAETREKLDQLKSAREFQIRAPRSSFGGTPSNSNGPAKCESKWGPIVVSPSDCNSAYFEAYLNRADLEAITGMLSTMQTQFTLLNSWRLDQTTTMKMVERDQGLTSAELAKWVNSGDAHLRSAKSLASTKIAIRDLAVSYQWMLRNQKLVCPIGKESKKNRPGYLFAFGLCFFTRTEDKTESDRLIRVLETIAQGGSVTNGMFKEKRFDFDFDWVSFLEKPLQNLSDVREVKINSCGSLQEVNEAPLKPYFAKGSFNEILDKSYTCYADGETEANP